MTAPKFHDSLYRLAQIGTSLGVQLVRLTACHGDNQYAALPVEFDSAGLTQVAENAPLTVLNLAEPADAAGTLPADTEAVAIDVEGKWVIFVRQAPSSNPSSTRLARVSGVQSGVGRYYIRWQECLANGQFQDTSDPDPAVATNLAELSFGSVAAVDLNTIVPILTVVDVTGVARYVFDHPAYAKYLD
ncbi:MAG: hypothetical protein FWE88_03010 [Phycisphaerae bacterium]|nr:hypothetical protein [Phycisphaerae bacterium]